MKITVIRKQLAAVDEANNRIYFLKRYGHKLREGQSVDITQLGKHLIDHIEALPVEEVKIPSPVPTIEPKKVEPIVEALPKIPSVTIEVLDDPEFEEPVPPAEETAIEQEEEHEDPEEEDEEPKDEIEEVVESITKPKSKRTRKPRKKASRK